MTPSLSSLLQKELAFDICGDPIAIFGKNLDAQILKDEIERQKPYLELLIELTVMFDCALDQVKGCHDCLDMSEKPTAHDKGTQALSKLSTLLSEKVGGN